MGSRIPVRAGMWAAGLVCIVPLGAAAAAGGPLPACPEFRSVPTKPSPDAYTRRGALYADRQRRECAQAAYRDALRMQPDYAPALYGLARVLLDAKRYSAAAGLLNRVLALRASEVLIREARLSLAEVYRASGKTADAVAVLKTLADAAPRDIAVQLGLANAYAADNRFEVAAEAYRRVLALEPGNGTAQLSLGKMLVSCRRFEEAIAPLEAYIRAHAADWEGHYAAGRAYQGAGQLPAAVRELRYAVQLRPGDYELRYYLSQSLSAAGDAAGAARQLETARRLNPAAEEILYALGRTLQEQGDKQGASRAFAALRGRQRERSLKDEAIGYERQGSQALAAGDTAAAAKFFRTAIELTNEGRDHYDLALALDRSGDRAAAYEELKRATALDPGLATAYNQLGLMELSGNRADQAETAFRKALTANPQFAEAKNNLGVLYARTGRKREAMSLFEAATEDDPNYPDAYANWGLVLAAEGELVRARACLQRALKLRPGLKQATVALTTVEAELKRQ